MNGELWPHQTAAIDLLYDALASGRRRPMLMMATGAGKTKTAIRIIERARAKGKRVIFTVPANELIDQTVVALGKEGLHEVGVIQAAHHMTDYSQPIQVASVHTLARRQKMPDADLVLVDEAHVGNKVVFRWMKEAEKLPFIGLSATPWTKGLGKHYDELIIGATTKQLIKEGFLSDFRVFAPSHPDLTGVKTVAGDYAEDQLSEAMNKPKLTADVVSTWMKLGEERPTLCFAVDRAHARSLANEFTRAGVSCGYVDGDTERADRKILADRFAKGEIKVVVNVGVLTTGVDWDVRCVILARPTKSEMLYVQIIGRGLRRADGKKDCLILDHSDTTLNLGFVTDIGHDRLSDGTERTASKATPKEPPASKPKECPKCSYLKPAGIHQCPSCGFAPQKVQDVETRHGELEHLGGREAKVTMEDKQRWYSMLLWHQDAKRYKHGWAAHKYKEKFKVWPSGMSHVRPSPPDVVVGNYIRSTMIAAAKRKGKEARVRNGSGAYAA